MSSDNHPSTPTYAEEVTHDDLTVPEETLQAQQEELSEKDIRFLLVKAAMNGDLEQVRRLVGEMDDIDGYLPEDRDLFKCEDEQGKESQKEPILTALQSAARWGHQEIVEELIEKGADIDVAAGWNGGRTALQAAAEGDHMAVVEMLLKAGAEVNAAPGGWSGRTALQAAAEGGHMAVVEMLLKAGAEVNAAPSLKGKTALQAAAGGVYKGVVEMLPKAGAEVNAAPPSSNGKTALQPAAEGGHKAVAEMLLKAGAEVNAAPSRWDGRTALQAAAEGGHTTVVEMLLKAGAEVNAAPSSDGKTALQAAAGGGHKEVVEMLLKAGAEVNTAPSGGNGRTALQAAAEGGHMAVVEMLLKAGAEVNAAPPSSNGRTALQAAAGGGHTTVVEMLLKAGAEVNTVPEGWRERTALQAAAGGGHKEVVEMLLKAGAEVNAAPSRWDGRAALQAAAEGGHKAVVEMLLKAGAGVNAGSEGRSRITALQAAAEGGHKVVVEMLLKAGAEVNAGPEGWSGRAALQVAAEGGHKAVVEMLLKAGVEVNAAPEGWGGRAALQAAAGGGHKVVVEMLLKAGAEVNAAPPSSNGRTALQVAAEGGYTTVVEMLLKAGAEVNAGSEGRSGRIALQAAAKGGYTTVVKMLLEARKADVRVREIVDLEFFKLVAIAIEHGRLAVLRLLVNAGASLGGEGSSQQTGLHLAVMHRQPVILRYILTKFPNLTNAQNYNGMTALHISTRENYVVLVRYLLEARPNLEIKDNKGRKPLDIALRGGSLSEISKTLLTNGADIRGRRMGAWRQILKPSDNELIFLQETSTGGNDIKVLDVDNVPKFWGSSDMVPRKRLYSGYGVQSKGAKKLFNLPTRFSSQDSKSHSVKNEATIMWKWAASDDDRESSSFIDGIPGDGGNIPTSFEGIIACHVSFDVLAPKLGQEMTDMEAINTEALYTNHLGRNKLMIFETKMRKAQIFWMMWKEATDSDPQRKGPIEPNTADLNTGSPTPICRSMHFRSTMDHGWIPSHGVEFFTLFIKHVHEQWTAICTAADIHLSDSRAVVLNDEGRSPQLIASLLKDAQQWDDFYRLLELHTSQAMVLSKFFRETPILNDEVGVSGLKNKGNALEDLENSITKMGDDCKRKISDLIERSKDLIQLEFNLVSIHEAQISTSTAMSMKRLSWITFVFLPLLFVASLFGMNVNLFNQGCPMWWWYLVVSGPAFALVFIVWLAFKYIKIEMWIETNAGVYLENVANSFSEKFKNARLNRGRTHDLESGSPSTPLGRLSTGRWFDSKKTKNS